MILRKLGGWVKGRLELFRKFFRFGGVTRPSWKVLMDEYFHYHGSLTTGTCDEAVNWMVFKVIVTIGKFLSDFPTIWELAPQGCSFFCLQNITRNTQAVSKFCSRFLVDMQANARSFLCDSDSYPL